VKTTDPSGAGLGIERLMAIRSDSGTSGSGVAPAFLSAAFITSDFFVASRSGAGPGAPPPASFFVFFASASAFCFSTNAIAEATGSRWNTLARPHVIVRLPFAHPTKPPASSDRRHTGTLPSLVPTSGTSLTCAGGSAVT
jgi:hypothetical protein